MPNDLPMQNHNHNLDSNENPILQAEEDSDIDEDNQFDDDNQGYVPLDQDDDEEDEFTIQTSQTEISETNIAICSNGDGQQTHHPLLQGPMNPAHAALIVQSMSNISLPSSATPEWARVVPEETWKESLLNTIAERQDPEDT